MGGGFLTGTQKTARSVSLGLCPGVRYGDRYLVMSASTYKRRSCGDGGSDRPLTRPSFHTSLRLPGYAKTKTISPVVRKKKRPNIPGGRYFMIYLLDLAKCKSCGSESQELHYNSAYISASTRTEGTVGRKLNL